MGQFFIVCDAINGCAKRFLHGACITTQRKPATAHNLTRFLYTRKDPNRGNPKKYTRGRGGGSRGLDPPTQLKTHPPGRPAPPCRLILIHAVWCASQHQYFFLFQDVYCERFTSVVKYRIRSAHSLQYIGSKQTSLLLFGTAELKCERGMHN